MKAFSIAILALFNLVIPSICQGQAGVLEMGLNEMAGSLAYHTTTVGAVANRNTANELYQQALRDEAAAWSSFPPNVGLLAKALKETQDAVKADDQSHHLAQSANKANNTGTHSAEFDLTAYGSMNVKGINDMINTSSPQWPTVSSKLKGYGLSLTEDKQYMVTPFGKFPTNATPEQMAESIKQIAGKFGLSGKDVDKAIAAAQAEADAIAKRVLAETQAKAAMLAATTKNKAKDESKKDSSKIGEETASVDGRKPASQGLINEANDDKYKTDWDEKARQLSLTRGMLGAAIGVDPVWGKDDDIFKKIHEHYVRLDSQDVFLPASAGSSKVAIQP